MEFLHGLHERRIGKFLGSCEFERVDSEKHKKSEKRLIFADFEAFSSKIRQIYAYFQSRKIEDFSLKIYL